MRRKRVSKPRQRTNKHIVITIPDEIKEQFPEAVKYITSLSPKQRGKLFTDIIIMVGIAAKEPNILKLVKNAISYTKDKREKNKKNEPATIITDKLEGLEEI